MGEYSALVFSGCLNLEDATRLVNYRGKLMQSAVPEGTAGMLVVLNMPINEVYMMIEKINETNETINFSTDNADGVSVLAGKNSAIEACKEFIADGEFRRVKTQMVQMSVPSHCYLLEEAQEELAKLLNEVEFKMEYLQKNNLSHLIDSGPGKTIINMARKIKEIDKTSLEAD